MSRDIHEFMKRKIAEQKKKNPELAYRFISKKAEDLAISMELEGWKPIKEVGSGTAGEIAIGDLLLAGRPRAMDDEQKKDDQKRARAAIEAPTQRYTTNLGRDSGGYVMPLTQEELSRKGAWTKR